MKLALVQFDPVFGDPARNRDQVAEILAEVSADVDVIVLPELYSSGYLFTSEDEVTAVAEPLDGPSLSLLADLARERNCAIAAGFAEAAEDGPYNSAVIFGPDGLLSHYRKLHLFDRETLWFRPGNQPLPVVEFRDARLGIMVCFDWRFPEAARTLALRGADVILHPSNLVLPWCPDAMLTRALENNVFVATADRWGIEDRGGTRLRFIGQSQVVTPRGERLGRLGEEETAVLEVEIDPADARDKQVTGHNDLWRDRREEFYLHSPE